MCGEVANFDVRPQLELVTPEAETHGVGHVEVGATFAGATGGALHVASRVLRVGDGQAGLDVALHATEGERSVRDCPGGALVTRGEGAREATFHCDADERVCAAIHCAGGGDSLDNRKEVGPGE